MTISSLPIDTKLAWSIGLFPIRGNLSFTKNWNDSEDLFIAYLTWFKSRYFLLQVFRVLDVFLLQGIETIFQVALGILKVARKDLLQQDFEGLMKYFRVNIPKTYRSEENAKHLMAVACAVKLKKLNKVSPTNFVMKKTPLVWKVE